MGYFLSLFFVIQSFSLSVEVDFNADNTTLTDYGEYTLISARDMDYFGRAYLPVLPAKRIQILLPFDAELKSVRSEGSDLSFVGSVTVPFPAPVQSPLGMRQDFCFRTDPSVYDGYEEYPGSILQNSHFGNEAGFKILSLLLVPYTWDPRTGELSMHEKLTVTVEYERTAEAQFISPLSFEIHKKIIGMTVCNPEMLHQWSPPVREGDFDYLIIAPSSFLSTSAIDSLVSHKSNRGLACDTASKEMISSSVSGSDLPEKIRNYIIQRHQADGITYVLLVGDKNLLQPREIFLNCRDTNGIYYDDSAPVDLYFADLDGSWNFNSDNRYGQPNDSLDLYADVFIGRLVVSSTSQLSVNVEKICQYETDPPQGEWRTRSLLAGAVLFDNQYYTITGEAVCESIADHLPSNWHHVKMYETLYSNSPEGAIDSVNEGVAWTQWAGHGNRNGVYWYNSSYVRMLHNNDIPNMTNGGKLAVHTSIACMTGAYHEGNCAAVSLLNKQGGGGIISDFNTSYGWEGILPAMGPSEYMNVWFAEAVFDSSLTQLGPAFYASKNKLIPFWDINYYGGYDRNLYTLLDRTYFGDPALYFVGTVSGVEEDITETVGTDDIQINLQKNWAHVQSPGYSQLKIFDVTGRMLYASYFWDSFAFDMTSQPSGVYIFAVVSTFGTGVERMVYVK